jgi:hypothetical protein
MASNDLRQDFTNHIDKIPRPLVMWNNDLAYEAYKVASTCKWQHGDTPGLGQNLNSADKERSLSEAVDIWWSEKAAFIKKGATCDECGHVGAVRESMKKASRLLESVLINISNQSLTK